MADKPNIKNQGSQVVNATSQTAGAKKGKVKTGEDLRTGKGK